MITIEVLYPELCTLFGDTGNIRYLQRCLPEASFKAVHLDSSETPFQGDLVYMGSMTEKGQEMAIKALEPYRGVLLRSIEAGRHFLFTGNALELCGQYIQDGERRIPALGAFSYNASRDMAHRHNSLYIGRFSPNAEQSMDIVGFRSQFSFCDGDFAATWCETKRGVGLMGDIESGEGVHIGNFIGTYLLGPLLPLNPDFTQYLMRELGSDAPIAFEGAAREAYEKRLSEFWTADAPKH